MCFATCVGQLPHVITLYSPTLHSSTFSGLSEKEKKEKEILGKRNYYGSLQMHGIGGEKCLRKMKVKGWIPSKVGKLERPGKITEKLHRKVSENDVLCMNVTWERNEFNKGFIDLKFMVINFNPVST